MKTLALTDDELSTLHVAAAVLVVDLAKKLKRAQKAKVHRSGVVADLALRLVDAQAVFKKVKALQTQVGV